LRDGSETAVNDQEIGNLVALVGRIDNAAATDDGRAHRVVWVAHASRVLAKASRFRELFEVDRCTDVIALREDCFGETPKPARETHALPGGM
jgi:hypothetical protein